GEQGAGLPGSQTRPRPGPLRRTSLARFSSSCHPLHCGLRVPGRRTEPFFPLRSRRPLGLTQSRNTAAILPSGLARFARNGITRGRLQPCAKPLPAYCSDNCRVVLFVELHFYNIVVLGDDRVGMMIAAYRMAEEGWTPDDAMKEMQAFGFTASHHLICPCLAHYENSFPRRYQNNPEFRSLQ